MRMRHSAFRAKHGVGHSPLITSAWKSFLRRRSKLLHGDFCVVPIACRGLGNEYANLCFALEEDAVAASMWINEPKWIAEMRGSTHGWNQRFLKDWDRDRAEHVPGHSCERCAAAVAKMERINKVRAERLAWFKDEVG